MSASWVFLVASEAISVVNQDIRLPGIGSYIALALDQKNVQAIFYAIAATFIVILIYDQLLFRPLLQWANKFRFEQNEQAKSSRSWLIDILQSARLTLYFSYFAEWFRNIWLNQRWLNKLFESKENISANPTTFMMRFKLITWYGTLAILIGVALFCLIRFIFTGLPLSEAWQAVKLGGATLLRVIGTVIICSVVWVPLGIWIGLRPQLARAIEPIIQFLAAFPAKVLFPLIFILIVYFHLNIEIWVTVLMILGSQWYILFNIIAGTSTIPRDYHNVVNNFHVGGWLWWKRLALPAIFPYYITGALTASGAAWNLSIIAEVVEWGDKTLTAYGLGAYITQYTSSGDFKRIALGITVMCLYVVLFNYFVWQKLYKLAANRFGMY